MDNPQNRIPDKNGKLNTKGLGFTGKEEVDLETGIEILTVYMTTSLKVTYVSGTKDDEIPAGYI